MVRTVPLVWICAAAVFLSGCPEKTKPVEVVEQKPAPKADPTAGLPLGGNLAEQLQLEAAARPKEAITAEAVLDALVKAEIRVDNTRQFIARTVLANYCFGGSTAKATTVTVCEYASVEAAKAGLEHSQSRAGPSSTRSLTQNKQTVMSLVRVDSPETKAEADKAIEIFTKL